jgi:deazaflavin-dependent oxidoreductase (nitroreductase family)
MRHAIDTFNRRFAWFHNKVYIATRGFLGHRWTLVPSLILHTTGRKTGLERSVVLVYARDGDDLLVVASNWGGKSAPAWLVNLEARAEASVNTGRRRFPVRAEIVMPHDARYRRLFDIADSNNRQRYTRYVALTRRPIPVVVLHPSR